MICDILSTVKKYDMIKKGESIAIGISGGADSVCLLHFLSSIKEEYGIVLKAVHVNHNIRGNEAMRDEVFVRDFCKNLGVELHVFSVDVPALAKEQGLSEEECGRNVRYKCFASVKADKIAVAHTLSDSAETVLFNLARGTGIKGVCGIPPVRGNIIRPLIECTRSDIEAYCRENGLSYVTDSTNLSAQYTRNKIRHNVIASLKEINPSFEKSVLRFTQIAAAEDRFISACAEELLLKAKDKNCFSRQVLLNADEAVLRRAAAKLLSKHMSKDVEEKHVELFCSLVKEGSGAFQPSKDLYVCAESDTVSLRFVKDDAETEPFCIKVGPGKFVLNGKMYELSLSKPNETPKDSIAIDLDGVEIEKLVLRCRMAGDKFTDLRRKNTKTLKKLFCEKKIPVEERNKLAVLASGSEVIFVEKIGVNAKYVPKKDTESVMLIEIKEVGNHV